MSTVENFLQNAPISKKLTYINAHRIADFLYQQILASHDAVSGEGLRNCTVFCFCHLSTTVNLSICNHWMAVFENIYLIPKKASLNTTLLRHIANPTRILQARDRHNFAKTVSEIKNIISQSELPVIIFDIGGYFAPYVDELSDLLGDRLRLVLEDTANGHIKYRDTAYCRESTNFKSVAYDSYKMAENVMVANVIVGHFDAFVSDWSITRPILVIGYGRIGRSLCFALRSRGARNIVVSDADRARLFMSATEGFESATSSQLARMADRFDFCFSMSGQKGVTPLVISSLKNNAYLSVVTSYDDEFDTSVKEIFESGSRERLVWGQKTIHIVNRGRPINLSAPAAFDARNLSLHFLFGRIFSYFLSSLGYVQVSDWEEDLFKEILSEIQSS